MLDCGQRNLTIDDLCNPCGVSCDEETCDNWKCAIACADKDFESRVLDETQNVNQSAQYFYFRNDNETSLDFGNSSGRALLSLLKFLKLKNIDNEVDLLQN